jgi:hypothetical protein
MSAIRLRILVLIAALCAVSAFVPSALAESDADAPIFLHGFVALPTGVVKVVVGADQDANSGWALRRDSDNRILWSRQVPIAAGSTNIYIGEPNGGAGDHGVVLDPNRVAPCDDYTIFVSFRDPFTNMWLPIRIIHYTAAGSTDKGKKSC